ncbi:S-phase kinase-associated protein 1-like [Trema orientale]|uniref:S-phase kinase-associated protein 1-like n=1 Tax=Trema orientale TaxID=63057 RepID=A0A2P5FNG7_TREOI|nr:S-phase kinase-associated protein 1-like [Trema orientale]
MASSSLSSSSSTRREKDKASDGVTEVEEAVATLSLSSSSSSTTTTTKDAIRLKAADGVTFEVEKAVATKLGAIKNMLEEGCSFDDENSLLLPNVSGRFLGMVLQWCEKHVDDDERKMKMKLAIEDDEDDGDGGHRHHLLGKKKPKDEVDQWDEEFVKDMDQATLYHLLMAADYLNGVELVDLLAEKVASMIRGRKVEEIRETFQIKNDFAPGQEEEIRRRNPWAFE